MSSAARIGFMQGRLSPQIDGKIQAFPWEHWRSEFPAAARIGIPLIEWTLDHDRLFENPLLKKAGRREIRMLSQQNGVSVVALTGDLFMQAPFWKADGAVRDRLVAEFDAVVDACADLGAKLVVVPLVDGGSVESPVQAAVLEEVLLARAQALAGRGMRVVFECNFPPKGVADFIAKYPPDAFGINYDIGNSASLGYDCGEEITAYAQRVVHVHIKDRIRGGTTVPLGTGNADLPRAIRLLERSGYRGQYVLQTARATDGDHVGALSRYRDMVVRWIDEAR